MKQETDLINNISHISEGKDTSIHELSNHQENYGSKVEFKDIFRIYKYKLNKILSNFDIKVQIKKFWELLEHNFEGESDKRSFVSLFTKIYRLIVPSFNYDEISTFLDGEWLRITKK